MLQSDLMWRGFGVCAAELEREASTAGTGDAIDVEVHVSGAVVRQRIFSHERALHLKVRLFDTPPVELDKPLPPPSACRLSFGATEIADEDFWDQHDVAEGAVIVLSALDDGFEVTIAVTPCGTASFWPGSSSDRSTTAMVWGPEPVPALLARLDLLIPTELEENAHQHSQLGSQWMAVLEDGAVWRFPDGDCRVGDCDLKDVGKQGGKLLKYKETKTEDLTGCYLSVGGQGSPGVWPMASVIASCISTDNGDSIREACRCLLCANVCIPGCCLPLPWWIASGLRRQPNSNTFHSAMLQIVPVWFTFSHGDQCIVLEQQWGPEWVATGCKVC